MRESEKTRIYACLMIFAGVVGLLLLAVGHFVHLRRVESPTSLVEGRVISHEPSYYNGSGSHTSSTCVVHYQVGHQTYNIVDTCGADVFGSADKSGDKVEVIYSTKNPSKGAVKRIKFFNCIGALSLPILIFGYLLLRKSRRMFDTFDED